MAAYSALIALALTILPPGRASVLAFAYWAVVETGRYFPARTMSMALLATPSLGILISAFTFGEPVRFS